jgi:basic membrane protein A
MIAALAGCGNSSSTASSSKASSTAASSTAASSTAASSNSGSVEIALVTDVGNIDDHSFNQACWEACKEYGTAHSKVAQYYRPADGTDASRTASIDQACAAGAKVVVLPGYLFDAVLETEQTKFPKVKFLGVDIDPSRANYSTYTFTSNVTSIKYLEGEAGFFAGYAAVAEGYRNIGFVGGMAVPAVIKYGQGYIYGAEQAAIDLKLADGAVNMNYWYSGTFTANDTIKAKASSWYTATNNPTDVIFSCGGGIYNSVLAAAKAANTAAGNTNKKMIGVDVDQANEDPIVITSAMKNLKKTTTDYLTALYASADFSWGTINGNATAGAVNTLGAKDGAVGLPTDTTSWRMTNFTKAQYDALYQKVVAGTITVPEKIVATDHVATVKVVTNYVAD